LNKIPINDTLQKLDRVIKEGAAYCYFNKPADPKEIIALEKRHGFRLPDSFKLFLEKFNGGMIVNKSLEKIIQRDNNLETAKWNATCILSTHELSEAYISMMNRTFGVAGQFGAVFPFIPFCKTSTNESLVFVTLSKEETESPVLDAFHEEPPETWGLVAEDFNTFLINYIDTGGNPDVIGDENRGTAANLAREAHAQETSEEAEKSEESDDEIIIRTTATLEIDPFNAWAYAERGLAYKSVGEVAAALEDLNKSIELDNSDSFYYFARGVLFEDLNKWRAALIDFDTAVTMMPDDKYYLNCRARVLCEMEKYEAALADVNRVIELEPLNILAYMTREKIFRSTGEVEKADADTRKIEELEEDEN